MSRSSSHRTRRPSRKILRGRSSSWLVALGGIVTLLGCAGPSDPRADVAAFRAALARDDLTTARSYLTDDPRLWWGDREGPGSPWTLGGGRWRAWDEHFRGHGEAGPWRVDGDRVSAVVLEMNDYYALTERGPQPYLRTYFIATDGRIAGTMISDAPGETRSRGRADEFDAWLLETHPREYEDLRPGGEIDPTGDRAPRTRARLEEWRRAVGLEPIPP